MRERKGLSSLIKARHQGIGPYGFTLNSYDSMASKSLWEFGSTPALVHRLLLSVGLLNFHFSFRLVSLISLRDGPRQASIWARKKTIDINILGRTVSGTHGNLPWTNGTIVPGANRDLSQGQTGSFVFDSTAKSPFCPVCSWDGSRFVPGTIVPQEQSEKCLCSEKCLKRLLRRYESNFVCPTKMLS